MRFKAGVRPRFWWKYRRPIRPIIFQIFVGFRGHVFWGANSHLVSVRPDIRNHCEIASGFRPGSRTTSIGPRSDSLKVPVRRVRLLMFAPPRGGHAWRRLNECRTVVLGLKGKIASGKTGLVERWRVAFMIQD